MTWEWDDDSISDEETLYRRIKKIPDCRTYDPVRAAWVVHPGALRRLPNEGLSVHLHSVLVGLKRNVYTLYAADTYGSICFRVRVPRLAGAGVRQTPAVNEPDPDLCAAHGDVLPPQPQKDRLHWKGVVNAIAVEAEWVQPAE